MKSFTVVVLFSALLVSGCGSDSDTESDSYEQGVDTIGSWNLACSESRTEEYIISINSIEVSISQYSELDCSGAAIEVLGSSGTYSIGDEFITDDGIVAYNLDLPWESEQFGTDVKQLVYRDGDLLYFGVSKDDNSRPTQIDFDSPLVLQ